MLPEEGPVAGAGAEQANFGLASWIFPRGAPGRR